MYKIYKDENYIIIVDVNKDEYFYGHAKEVLVDKSNKNKGTYTVSNVKDFSENIVLNIGEIQKEDGVAYSESEWDTFYRQNTGFNTALGGSGAGGGDATIEKTQNAHGLVVGDAIYFNGTNYLKALADDPNTSAVIGVVIEVADANTFTYQSSGVITVGSWTSGEDYFLSTTVAGAIVTEPTYNVGEVRQFIGQAISTTELFLNIDTGFEITGAISEKDIEGTLVSDTVTGTHTIDLDEASDFHITCTGATTFSFSNLPTTDKVKRRKIRMSGNTPTWSGTDVFVKGEAYDEAKWNDIVVEIWNNGGVIKGILIYSTAENI